MFTCVDSTSGPSPYVSFGDVSVRDLWLRLIKELLAGMSLVICKLLIVYQYIVLILLVCCDSEERRKLHATS